MHFAALCFISFGIMTSSMSWGGCAPEHVMAREIADLVTTQKEWLTTQGVDWDQTLVDYAALSRKNQSRTLNLIFSQRDKNRCESALHLVIQAQGKKVTTRFLTPGCQSYTKLKLSSLGSQSCTIEDLDGLWYRIKNFASESSWLD